MQLRILPHISNEKLSRQFHKLLLPHTWLMYKIQEVLLHYHTDLYGLETFT